MPKIEASQRDVPLFEVAEHIVGALGQVVLRYEDLDPTASGLLHAAEGDVGYEHVRALIGNWEAPLRVDHAIVQAWDRALADLIKAAGSGGLKVGGRASKGEDSKELRPGDFPTRAHNPFANALDLEVEFSGERILEFDDQGLARIVGSGPNGGLRVLQTGLCADSWEEVLRLWPADRNAAEGTREPTDLEIAGVIRAAAREAGRLVKMKRRKLCDRQCRVGQ
jgi:hypothetical protein